MMAGFERNPALGTPEFNGFATGNKLFGLARSMSATNGPVSSDGYEERAARLQARRRALQNRLRMASQNGTMMPTGPTTKEGY